MEIENTDPNSITFRADGLGPRLFLEHISNAQNITICRIINDKTEAMFRIHYQPEFDRPIFTVQLFAYSKKAACEFGDLRQFIIDNH